MCKVFMAIQTGSKSRAAGSKNTLQTVLKLLGVVGDDLTRGFHS